jgi:hypothetical protein
MPIEQTLKQTEEDLWAWKGMDIEGLCEIWSVSKSSFL